MRSSSQQIYNYINHRSVPVTNEDLALILNLHDKRDLQGAGNDEGILERAREDIFREYGVFLVTNFSGSMIVRDADEAEAYVQQLWVRAAKSFESIRAMKQRLSDARGKKELTLFQLD